MRVQKLLLPFLIILFPFTAIAQMGVGSYNFLNVPISARVSALGGNNISSRDNDLNISLNNPSLLTDSMDNNIALSYVNYFADVNYYFAGYAKSFKSKGIVSGGIQYMDYGTFIRTDEFGNKEGTFKSSDMSINLSYANSVFDTNLFVGATVKTIYSQMDTYYSWGTALDFGAVYARPAKRFSIAYVVKNVGRQWKPYTVGNYEKLPFEMQIGFTKQPKHVPFRFSLTYENLEKWDLTYVDPNNPSPTKDPLTGKPIKVSKFKTFGDKFMRHMVIGGEFLLTKNFFLRGGYNYQRRKELKIPERRGMAGFSFGFG
ncbi:MAG TPA: type IX secretion system protein PorQ, partial [Bacteroidia bacterium]|nr:type IX secretion system protein PorQ [Bacteroidia bacterium]